VVRRGCDGENSNYECQTEQGAKPSYRLLMAGIIVSLAVVGLLRGAFGEDQIRVARPAPSFTIKLAPGRAVKLANFKDKALIVCFLATWDNFSQKQMTVLNDLQKQYGETNLAVLGLVLDQSRPDLVKAYAEQHHLNYPLYLANYDLIQSFGGLTAMPTTFVIDKNQNIIQTYVGVTETNVLDADLKAISKQ
jgi:peroxiredoxin